VRGRRRIKLAIGAAGNGRGRRLKSVGESEGALGRSSVSA
tara:strand:- start:1 stop:120 length:120 start_codon:yes stop_codon:yes gene_type:complete